MNMADSGPTIKSGGLCEDPEALRAFFDDLLKMLHLQAKETERLLAHVEQHTDRMIPPSQMALVVSELSELHARLLR
jgi:hypothetical protein